MYCFVYNLLFLKSFVKRIKHTMRKSEKQDYEIQDDTPRPCFTSYLCS